MMGQLLERKNLTDHEIRSILESSNEEGDQELFTRADQVRRQYYGTDVYIRGLIEVSNICKNDCYYCGIRRSNTHVHRYHLTKEEILSCCKIGYELGFRTFVMQGGEDGWYTDERMCDIVSEIRRNFKDCAITLSLGERTRESYQRLFDAGANRYLLRHETASDAHYGTLHPKEMSLVHRKQCLWDLKEIGYQVGSGFMVGSPGQTTENLLEDLHFLQELQPDMIGIGPFVPHKDTPFGKEKQGTVELTLRLLAILRLLFPYALIPATTALGTIHPQGREMGLKAGANVLMPNLSPKDVRSLYELYNNKLHTGVEAAEHLTGLEDMVEKAGYHIVTARGDVHR